MPKHPTSSRVPKPEPEPDDKFILFVERVAIWARENTRLIIVAAILAVVVVAGGIYYVESQRRVEAEAATRLTEIQQTVMTGNVPLAIRDLQTYLNSFGGTRAGREARLILADLLIAQERPAEAIDALGNLHRDLDEPVGLAAAQLLAAAYEALEQYDDAIDTYRRVASNARFEFQRREALSAAARVALETGQANLAADLYDRLVGTFDESDPARSYYEMWRAEARIRGAAGPQVQPAGTPSGEPDGTEDSEEDPAID
jgi:predicted negative regulator of RcsB-dependent stress response